MTNHDFSATEFAVGMALAIVTLTVAVVVSLWAGR